MMYITEDNKVKLYKAQVNIDTLEYIEKGSPFCQTYNYTI